MSRDLNEQIMEYLKRKHNIDPYAIIAYGSRVAGYAIESSDYDYIVVIDGFKEKIKYLYDKILDNIYVSFLLVDKEFFEEDVIEGKHGEFVSGRLYNVFIPVLNEGYIHKMEIILKSRAILEELCILRNMYGRLSSYLIIPLKYILYSRLKKRMLAYPIVKYSYYKTYYGPKGSWNLAKSLEGFKEAARKLANEGFVRYNDNMELKFSDEKDIKCDFREIVKILSRGFKMYLTHGRSAKVDLKVIFDEMTSKVKRSLENISIPPEFKDPTLLLKLEEGLLITSHKPINEVIKEVVNADINIVGRKRKGVFSELYIIDAVRDHDALRFIVKNFSYIFIFKWIFIIIWLVGLKSFNLSPKSRLINEYIGSSKLNEIGIKVPRIYAILWKDNSLVSQFINGLTLNSLSDKDALKAYYIVGQSISRVHNKLRLSLGDLKPNNIIYLDGDVYFVDLEQYGLDSNFSWDIGELIYYSNTFWNLKRNYLDIIDSFLKGYSEGFSNKTEFKKIVSKTVGIRFIIAFSPLVPLNRILKIRRHILNFLKKIG